MKRIRKWNIAEGKMAFRQGTIKWAEHRLLSQRIWIQILILSLTVQFSSVQSLSRVWLFAAPWTAAWNRPPCSSPTPEVYSNSCPSCRWCHPTSSSSVIPFSSRLQSYRAFLFQGFYLRLGLRLLAPQVNRLEVSTVLPNFLGLQLTDSRSLEFLASIISWTNSS